MKKLILSVLFLVGVGSTFAQRPPMPYGAIPTENQVKWNEMEYYAFVHFSINTYLNTEWGFGDQPASVFNPTSFNAEQWAATCKAAGMKGIILTAKHHDGFCLWPSKYTEYSVKNSPYKNGKGDIVKEVSDACRKYGLKFGVYLSPWDRNHPEYGREQYVEYFHNQIKELLTQYGDIFEVWFDGANGGDGYYGGANETRKIDSKTYYQWNKVKKIVRQLQPNAIIWGDAADARWVGNEKGYANETNWSTIDVSLIEPGNPENKKYLVNGMDKGKQWSPAEADVSIRPWWYYSPLQDNKVKTLPHLLDIYYKSVGRNANLLLNIPIDMRGLIHKNDSVQLIRLGNKIKEDFAYPLLNEDTKFSVSSTRENSELYSAKNLFDNDLKTYWAVNDNELSATLEIDLQEPTMVNRFMVQENIYLGQRVKSFKLEAFVNGEWKLIKNGSTIGYKRILRFPPVKASKIRFTVEDALATPVISTVQLYNAPLLLDTPTINTVGNLVEMTPSDIGIEVYYTTDANAPKEKYILYKEPFELVGKDFIAVCYDPYTKQYSDEERNKYPNLPSIVWILLAPFTFLYFFIKGIL